MSYLQGNETDEELEGKCILAGIWIKQGEYVKGSGELPKWYAVHIEDGGRYFFMVTDTSLAYKDYHHHADKRTVMRAALRALDNKVRIYKP